MKFDWKFVLPLIIAIAGVAIPVWLWQADQTSKSVSVKLATHIPLQPKEQDAISGIEISADGLRLEKPHLVIFEIRNDGSKPIPSTDFENPIRIHLVSESSIARASISSKTPKDIEAALLTESQAIVLRPTLLNPGDSITVTAITSGAPPVFEAAARIIGITNIELDDSTAKKPSMKRMAVLLFGAILSFISYSLMSDVITQPNGIFLRRRAAVLVGIVAIFSGAIALQTFLEEIDKQGYLNFFLWYLMLMITAGFVAYTLNRTPKEPAANAGDK